jgi:Glycosyl hydrolase family 65, C-terminal domain
VPHQLFASAGFVSGLLRGLVGFDGATIAPSAQAVMTAPATPAEEPLVLTPSLPPGWREITVRELRWRQHRISLHLDVRADNVRIDVEATPGPLPIVVDLRLPPGADPASVRVAGRVTGRISWEQAIRRPGLSLIPEHIPLVAGARSSRLRIIEVRGDGDQTIARIAGRAGKEYEVDVEPAQTAANIRADGATVRVEPATAVSRTRLRLTFPPGDDGWREAQVTFVRTGRSK